MADCIRPEGWNNWGRKEREQTARYSEFGNTGAGADATGRAAWAKQLSQSEAEAITPDKVFGDWQPKK
jgi:pectinesterase